MATSGGWDAIVLGAGVSGLVCASVLQREGLSRVALVDTYEALGGNHLSFQIGPFTFDVGSLIFQDDSPFLEHYPTLLDEYIVIHPTWAKLSPSGHVSMYPFDLRHDLLGGGLRQAVLILLSAVRGRAKRNINNVEDYLTHWIGREFAMSSGLSAYVERFLGRPASEVAASFAQSRMRWIEKNASLRSIYQRLVDTALGRPSVRPTNSQLARPFEGFTSLYELVLPQLRSGGSDVFLGQKSLRMVKFGDQFVLKSDSMQLTTRRLISTMPIQTTLDMCDVAHDAGLDTVTLISLFYSYAGSRGFNESILYNFTHGGAWKRLTMHSDFYGRRAGREYFTVEVVAREGSGTALEADADFRATTLAAELFAGDLILEGSHRLDHAYPIFSHGATERVSRSIDILRQLGVESLGRQGGFRYQPTARTSTLQAEADLRSAATRPAPPRP